jgi:hypothetical protein
MVLLGVGVTVMTAGLEEPGKLEWPLPWNACWRHGDDGRLGGTAAESGQKSGDEVVKISRFDVHVGRIEFRPNRDIRSSSCFRTLRDCNGTQTLTRNTRGQNDCKSCCGKNFIQTHSHLLCCQLLKCAEMIMGFAALSRFRWMPAVVALARETHGRGTRNLDPLCMNPCSELLPKHPPREAKKPDDGGLFTRMST